MLTTATKTKTFTYYTDPGHGWIGVHEDDLKAVGLHPQDFSRYSYRHLHNLYLEEDCDAALFVSAFIRHFGEEPKIEELHSDRDSVIRRFRRLNSH